MMGKRRSFKEFIAENFEDQIYQSVERYYNANETRINITSNRFYSITDTYLDNVSIRYVNAEDCDTNGMKIRFYPIVVATIVIEGKTRYDVDTDSQELWLRLHCSGDLSIGLRDFRVSNVEELDSAECFYGHNNLSLKDLYDPLNREASKVAKIQAISENFIEFLYLPTQSPFTS